MTSTTRDRFILLAISGYFILALAWILLSDQLLSVFADIDTVIRLSTAMGVFFAIATTALFFLALRSVPPIGTATLEDNLVAGVTPGWRPRWLTYTFAVALTLAMLLVRESIASSIDNRPMLILFMLPIILSALLGGLGPGLVSTALASIGTNYFALPPLHSLRIASSQDLFQWSFLIVNGVAVSLLSEALRQSGTKATIDRLLPDDRVFSPPNAIFVKDTHRSTFRFLSPSSRLQPL